MHTLPKVPGTKVRGTTYHLNIPVPADLRADYGGKRVLEGTLRTSDPNTARIEVQRLQVEFRDKRDAAKLKARLTDERKAERDRQVAALDPADRAFYDRFGGTEAMLAAMQRVYFDMALDQAAHPASNFPGAPPEELEEEVVPDEPDAAFAAEARFLASERGLEATMAAYAGQTRHLRAVATAVGTMPDAPPSFVDEGSEGLRDLSLRFAEARSYTTKNRDTLAYTVRRWTEFHGDLPLAKLTRKHLSEFDDALKKLPPATHAGTGKLPMRGAIALAAERGLPLITEKVRERFIQHLMQMMAHALDKGDVAHDPWAGYRMDRAKVKVSVRRKAKRKAFTPAQVGAILAYVAKNIDARTMDWWLPALAAYTGATREELGQLRIDDVLEEDGFLCIRITDEGEHQTVKNEHRFRTLPVPRAVLDMGFAVYVDVRRTAAGTMLWQELFHDKQKRVTLQEVQPDADGRYTENYGHRFTRKVLVALGIKTKELTFHSFRHSWTDAARQAPISDEIRRLLAGRMDEGSDRVEAGYGGGNLIRAKVKGIEEIAHFVVETPAPQG